MFPDFTNYTFPDWATSDAVRCWLFGFIVGAMVRIFRAAQRWFKRAGTESVQ